LDAKISFIFIKS